MVPSRKNMNRVPVADNSPAHTDTKDSGSGPLAFSRAFPGVIRIEPSSLCTLRCLHCPTGTVKFSRGVMDAGTFARILENIRVNIHNIRVVVLYHGGEPFLNKEFLTMVRKIKDSGVPHIKTDTNGTLLNLNLIQQICESGLDEIVFSLDGTSFEQNDTIRRGCDGRRVSENIKKLAEYKRTNGFAKPDIFIATTQFLEKCKKIGDQLPAIPQYLHDFFADEITRRDLSFRTTFAMKWPDLNMDEELFEVICDSEGPQIRNFCDDIISTITIRWNGDIVPCCYDLTSKMVMGNLLKEDIGTVWNNKKYLRLRKGIYEKKFCPLCDSCNIVKPRRFLLLKEPLKNWLNKGMIKNMEIDPETITGEET